MENQPKLQPAPSVPLNIAYLLLSVSFLIYSLIPTNVMDGVFYPETIRLIAIIGFITGLILGALGGQQQKRLGVEKPTMPSLWVRWIATPILLIALGFIIFAIYNIFT